MSYVQTAVTVVYYDIRKPRNRLAVGPLKSVLSQALYFGIG